MSPRVAMKLHPEGECAMGSNPEGFCIVNHVTIMVEVDQE